MSANRMDIRPPGDVDLMVIWAWLKSLSAPLLGYLTAVIRSRYRSGRKSWKIVHLEGALIALATVAAKPIIAAFGLSADMAYAVAVYLGFVGVETLSCWLVAVVDKYTGGK